MKTRNTRSAEPGAIVGACAQCDPGPAEIERLREARFSLGQMRVAHYLEYHDTGQLEAHLRGSVPRFPKPAMGYDYDEWLFGVLAWHRQKRAAIVAEKRRAAGDADLVGPETIVEAAAESWWQR